MTYPPSSLCSCTDLSMIHIELDLLGKQGRHGYARCCQTAPQRGSAEKGPPSSTALPTCGQTWDMAPIKWDIAPCYLPFRLLHCVTYCSYPLLIFLLDYLFHTALILIYLQITIIYIANILPQFWHSAFNLYLLYLCHRELLKVTYVVLLSTFSFKANAFLGLG